MSTAGDDEEHEECGRPLGLRLLDDTTLLVIDIHIGLLSISTVTGDTEVLVKQGEVVDGLPVVRLNDLDVDLDKRQVCNQYLHKHLIPLSYTQNTQNIQSTQNIQEALV